jgi:hypothetical protein
MKKMLTLLAILAFLGSGTAGADEAADAKAIKETVANYLEGWFSSDPTRMEKALHPNLSKVTIRQIPESSTEFLDIMTAERLIAFTGNNAAWVKDKKTHTMDIVYQDDRIAIVHGVSDDFYDVCGLIKLNGEWKLVHVLWAMNPTEE